MMRSLYSGVAGLKTHQTKMDVIGNNIANVNTVGFKSSSVTFSDIMYQTTQHASGANETTGVGGVNAKQIGLGVSTAATKISITSAGAAESTGNAFDIMLNDANTTNFFIVNNGSENVFTRSGSFYVDSAGNLCMASTGYNVMGWQVVEEVAEDGTVTRNIQKDTVSALRIMSADNATSDAEATTQAMFSGIVDQKDSDLVSDEGLVSSLTVYDKRGYSYTLKFKMTPVDANNDGTYSTAELASGKYNFSLTKVIDADGTTLVDINDTTNNAGESGLLGAAVAASIMGGTNSWTVFFNPNDGSFSNIYDGQNSDNNTDTNDLNSLGDGETVGLLNLTELSSVLGITGESNFSNVTVDFTGLSNVDNGGTSNAGLNRGASDGTTGAGKKVGTLTGVSVDTSGKIYGSYDNGNTELLGQIAVAQFANASGLEALGDSCYQTTLNSGDFDGIGVDITADGGSMTTGALEMSNVDLASEFTSMITTQRGFQANSRIITTSDTMLEELINLKR